MTLVVDDSMFNFLVAIKSIMELRSMTREGKQSVSRKEFRNKETWHESIDLQRFRKTLRRHGHGNKSRSQPFLRRNDAVLLFFPFSSLWVFKKEKNKSIPRRRSMHRSVLDPFPWWQVTRGDLNRCAISHPIPRWGWHRTVKWNGIRSWIVLILLERQEKRATWCCWQG